MDRCVHRSFSGLVQCLLPPELAGRPSSMSMCSPGSILILGMVNSRIPKFDLYSPALQQKENEEA